MNNYPPNMTCRPLEVAFAEHPRKRAPFRSSLTSTLSTLRHELHQLGGGGPRSYYDHAAYPPSVLQLALRDRDIRMDGMPRADSKVSQPGIVLNIEPPGQNPMSFPCDTYEDWQDNVRAVTLTLEALRKIDRYGVTQTGQQYRGWQALPAAPTGRPEFTVATAEKYLRSMAVDEGAGLDLGTLQQVYRRAAARTHPDRNGGDRAQWNLVEEAATILRAADKLA